MDTRNVKRNHEDNTEETTQKRHKVQTKENPDDLGIGKFDNFVVQQKFNLTDKFRLKDF